MSKPNLQSKSDLLAKAEIATEYATLQNKSHTPLGMYVIPASDSPFSWQAVLFVHQGNSSFHKREPSPFFFKKALGFYADSILKFTITFPTNYPEDRPSVTFITDVFHPLISPQDGSLNMNSRFPSWRSVSMRFTTQQIFKQRCITKAKARQDC